jgi:hypothetical protein
MQEMLFNAHLAYLSNRMYVLRARAAEVTTHFFSSDTYLRTIHGKRHPVTFRALMASPFLRESL